MGQLLCSQLKSIEPLYSGVYDDTEIIGHEIEQAAAILQDSAAHLLLSKQPMNSKEDILSSLYAKS